MILSILIPTVPQRANLFFELHTEINKQLELCNGFGIVEVISDDSPVGTKTTGKKRNDLLNAAKGKYVWFVDDDDMILPNAINLVLAALEKEPDALAINGFMTTNGRDKRTWYISKDNPYITDYSSGQEVYLRSTNHITPIKREIAKSIKFEDKSNFEDYAFCMELKKFNLIKTEVEIKEPIYHYRYIDYDKLY
jgi:glycosyltransferase involved in cell wall biosynthesis